MFVGAGLQVLEVLKETIDEFDAAGKSVDDKAKGQSGGFFSRFKRDKVCPCRSRPSLCVCLCCHVALTGLVVACLVPACTGTRCRC